MTRDGKLYGTPYMWSSIGIGYDLVKVKSRLPSNAPYNSWKLFLDPVNLKAMQSMMKDLDSLVGYSDHTIGSQVSVMAVSLGACVIEKHLTLDNKLPGPDHAASANPKMFKQTVEDIRRASVILGSPVKKPGPNELQYIPMVRRSIVATRDIKKGERFSPENLDLKRPGIGMAPVEFASVMGRKARRDISYDAFI